MTDNNDNRSLKITEINEVFEREEMISREYLVEEPLELIFEPRDDIFDAIPPTNNISPRFDMNQEHTYKNGVKFSNRIAHMVSENNGILEYQYKSINDIKSNIDDDEEYFENYFNDFDYKNHHLNAVIRSISLSKCPGIAKFGFDLARYTNENEDLYYIKEIAPDTPAELCLRLGDILMEIDEKNPCEAFIDISELNDYLSKAENIHMMVIHESKYMRLKAQDENLIKNYCSNCEDMVIVTWNNHFETNLIQ